MLVDRPCDKEDDATGNRAIVALPDPGHKYRSGAVSRWHMPWRCRRAAGDHRVAGGSRLERDEFTPCRHHTCSPFCHKSRGSEGQRGGTDGAVKDAEGDGKWRSVWVGTRGGMVERGADV
jgi:hypothetical protein